MIPTEPIGSIPRSQHVIEAYQKFDNNELSKQELENILDEAVKQTILEFESTGSPILCDGEQTKPSFVTYPICGLNNLSPDGVKIPFKDGHFRQLPILTKGPFKYSTYASSYLRKAQQYTKKPLKQAVISASAMSLLYPQDNIDGYSRESFMQDLVNHAVMDIRNCLGLGAVKVQIDFTEGRLAIKLDPSKSLLKDFITINNNVLSHFNAEERKKIGIHTCPGGDQDSTHSKDIDYNELLPLLFELNANNFYIQYASEKDPISVLKTIKKYRKPQQTIFIGVIDVLEPQIEDPKDIAEKIIQASEYIPIEYLGTTDDCGFSPFSDDVSTSRGIAFSKIKARLEGTKLAAQKLGL